MTLLSVALSACSKHEDGSSVTGRAGATNSGAGSTGVALNLDGGPQIGVSDGDSGVSNLTITPPNAVLQITVVNGKVTAVTGGADAKGTLSFEAQSSGAKVPAQWTIDRGELGALDFNAGTFVPSGNYSGVGTISASYGKAVAQARVTIQLSVTQNGGTWDPTATKAGVGGIGGVGGEPAGGPVDDATRMRLSAAGMAPSSAAEFGLLYPYDHTVWPRGLFAPLLQWQTKHSAVAVSVHLSQSNFDFRGYYAVPNAVRAHIDQRAWQSATNGNAGDPLHVEVSIADATQVYGPVAEDWTIAPGQLKGTVYYNSYATTLANRIPDAESAAAVLAIRPGQSDPVLALAGAKDQCIVCHNVSDDGSTLFAQVAKEPDDDYSEGSSFDLLNGGARIQDYVGAAPDGTSNNRKFLWSALAKDGTYALQSSAHTREAYAGPSRIFRRDTGNAEAAAGFDGQVVEAVTPSFSRDGTRVAFNYWTGTLAPGGGGGRTLDMMDFSCTASGSASGAPSCANYSFANLVRLFTSPNGGTPGWPAWLPDSSGIVFQNNLSGNSPFETWENAKTEIWFVGLSKGGGAPASVRLDALNGNGADGKSSLPVASGVAGHDDDNQMNYEPTVNPIVSGGYAWVVFTSRRMYGNLAQGDPYEVSSDHPIPKKLWVAAVDLNWKPGQDPSHPAFYLPGQELNAGNMRGFWVVDPCHQDGLSCETGDECCSGYCRPDSSGKLVCGGKPSGCAMEFEKCTTAADCCSASAGTDCVNGFCASAVVVK
jgi:hypothetical protein